MSGLAAVEVCRRYRARLGTVLVTTRGMLMRARIHDQGSMHKSHVQDHEKNSDYGYTELHLWFFRCEIQTKVTRLRK